jgi:rod shape determining protein RodA
MWKNLRAMWKSWDVPLITFTVLLMVVGLAELYSSSLTRPDLAPLFLRQLTGAGVGLIAMLVIARTDYRTYRSWSKLIYFAALALLIVVLVIGQTIRGTTGWLHLGFFGFQPVELIKIMWVLVLAGYLAHVGPPLTWGKTIAATLLLAPLIGLVLAQPDFGSGSMLIVVWAVMLAAVPKFRSWWVVMGILAVVAILVGTVFLKDYQRARIGTFLNPWKDPLGSGYNVTQSVIAVGSGGLWGRGLGLGTQSQLKFLPEQHTDFIFASIAEELGFVGGALVLGLWVGFMSRVVWLIRRLRDDYAVLVALGVGGLIAVQAVLNIGMNLGLAPVVGVPLPFISFGSSSLVASLIGVGILENLAMQYGRQAPTTVTRA